jgi:hypothetical protein
LFSMEKPLSICFKTTTFFKNCIILPLTKNILW